MLKVGQITPPRRESKPPPTLAESSATAWVLSSHRGRGQTLHSCIGVLLWSRGDSNNYSWSSQTQPQDGPGSPTQRTTETAAHTVGKGLLDSVPQRRSQCLLVDPEGSTNPKPLTLVGISTTCTHVLTGWVPVRVYCLRTQAVHTGILL